MKYFIMLTILVFSRIVFAGITENQIEIKIEGDQIIVRPQKGFHINDKAPASMTHDNLKVISKPQIKTEQKLTYKILPQIKKANLKFFVCDDAKTVCEQREKTVHISDQRPEGRGSDIISTVIKSSASKTEAQKNVVGVADQRPRLLIFSAPWCPACIRMASETYTKKSVQKLFSKLNVQKINIDLIENEKISDQFHVKAIPTLILLNTKGEEIYRWLDYQPAEQFAQELAAESKNSDSIEQLKSKADDGNLVAAKKLAKIYSGQMDWANSAKYFSLLKDQESVNQKLNANINALSDEKDKNEKTKKEYLEVVEKSIALTSSKIDKLRWTLDFFETKEIKKDELDKPVVQKIISDLNVVMKDKYISKLYAESTLGDMAGFEKVETLDMRSRAEMLLGRLDDKKASQEEIVKLIMDKKHNVNFPGQMINSIGYLSQAGAFAESEKLILQLVEKYQNSYVYHQRYANFLTKQKRNTEALIHVDQALIYKDGNEPQLNLLKIKILKGLDKKTEALALTNETLKLIEASPEKYKRTRATLMEFQNEFLNK